MKIKKIIAVIMLSMWYIAGVQAGEYAEDHALSGTETGHNDYEAENTIQSTQVIESGRTTYTAGKEIRLLPGFHAKEGSEFHAAIDDPSNRLTIMTYNLEKSNYKDNAKVIRLCSPDIVSIQEVCDIDELISDPLSSFRMDLMENILRELGLDFHINSYSNLKEITGLKGEFHDTALEEIRAPLIANIKVRTGIVLLWNKEKLGDPVSVKKYTIETPNDNSDSQRGYIVAQWNDFVVIATHLSTGVDDNKKMVIDIVEKINSIEQLDKFQNRYRPIIIAGDLNPRQRESNSPRSDGGYETKKYLVENGFEILNEMDRTTSNHYYLHTTSGKNEPGGQPDLILWNNQNQNSKTIWRGTPECFYPPDLLYDGYEGGKYHNYRLKLSDHLPYLVKVKFK